MIETKNRVDVRVGSKADLTAPSANVRFVPLAEIEPSHPLLRAHHAWRPPGLASPHRWCSGCVKAVMVGVPRSSLRPRTDFQASRLAVVQTVPHRRGSTSLCGQARRLRALRAKLLRRRPQHRRRPLPLVLAGNPCSQGPLQRTPAQVSLRRVLYAGSRIPGPLQMLPRPN